MTAATRDRLLTATIEVLAGPGIAGLSARSVATAAEANQALIFYHFGSIAELVGEATRRNAAETVERYRAAMAAAGSLTDLFEVGRRLHAAESARGTVRVMAQLLAAAQSDEQYAAPARDCLEIWFAAVRAAVERLLARSPLQQLVNADDFSRAVGAAFLGLELYEGVDPEGANRAMDSVASLGVLLDVLDGLGPVERKMVAARLQSLRR